MDSSPSVLSPAPVREEMPISARKSLSRGGAGQPSPGAQPESATPAPPPSPQEEAEAWAICCSGGGIRSATYCLGGLQSLDEGGLLGKARWILGVSGGSYIAASRALVAHGLRGAHGRGQAVAAPAAYARGTPEEQNLRNNTHYLAPDAKTVLVAVLSLLLGAAVTCILAVAPLYALGHAWGWLLRAQAVLTWPEGKASVSVTAWTWWLAPAIAAAITLALFWYWWVTLVSGGPGRGAHRARMVGWAAAITAGLALLMLAAPLVIAWLDHSTGALGTIVRFFGFGGSGRWSPATLAGLVAAMVAAARSSQKQLARLRLPAAAAGSPPGVTTKLAVWARAKLTPWLASLVIVAAGAFATLLWIGNSARMGYSAGQLVPVLAAVALLLATRALADINRTSLHDFYRWRLADAYAITREAIAAKAPHTRGELFAKAARTRLSELRSDHGGPALVIAGTANINANREVPRGRGGFCLAFDPDKVTLRGDPRCGEPEVTAETTDYEHLLGHTRFTLFDVVAISGAAFSPLMGAATRSAYRIFLTFTNMRLGVWMPHPAVVRSAREYLTTSPEKRERDRWWTHRTWLLLLWYLSQHWFWHRGPEKHGKHDKHDKPDKPAEQNKLEKQKKRDNREKLRRNREARLWAHVLELRELSTEGKESLPRTLARLRAAVCWRVMQPTLGLLWAEAAGHTSYRATWINVTDGGHYDNLGLVEALHRGAKNIVVLDASGDRPDTWFTLGGAMALARTDAGVEISLDPTTMIRGNGQGAAAGLANGQGAAARLDHGQVLRPWAHGTFTRPNGQAVDGHLPLAGNIWVCKLGWWDGTPWDIRAYAAGHPDYPCETTLQQLYDGAEFEAYHELGACAVTAAATGGRLPLLLPPRWAPASPLWPVAAPAGQVQAGRHSGDGANDRAVRR